MPSNRLGSLLLLAAACSAPSSRPLAAPPLSQNVDDSSALEAALFVVRASECEAAVQDPPRDRFAHWAEDVELVTERLPDEPNTAVTLRGLDARASVAPPASSTHAPAPGTSEIVDDLEAIVRPRRELDLDAFAAALVDDPDAQARLEAYVTHRRTMQLSATRIDTSTIEVSYRRFDEPLSTVIEGAIRLTPDALGKWKIVRMTQRLVEQVAPVVFARRFDQEHFAEADRVVEHARASGDVACTVAALIDAQRPREAFELLMSAPRELVARKMWMALQLAIRLGRVSELREEHPGIVEENPMVTALAALADQRSSGACGADYPEELGHASHVAPISAYRVCSPVDEERLAEAAQGRVELSDRDFCSPSPKSMREFLFAWVRSFATCHAGSTGHVDVSFVVDGNGEVLASTGPDVATSTCVNRAFDGLAFPRFRLRPSLTDPEDLIGLWPGLARRVRHLRALREGSTEPPEDASELRASWEMQLRVNLGPDPSYSARTY